MKIFCQRRKKFKIIFQRRLQFQLKNLPDIHLDVKASDTIYAILDKIAKIDGSPVKQFSISFPETGNYLERGKTLSDYNISKDIVLLLDSVFYIFIEPMSGNTSSIFIDASMTINEVKTVVLAEFMPNTQPWPEIQLLFGTTEMEDYKYVANYGLKADSRVSLVIGPRAPRSFPGMFGSDDET